MDSKHALLATGIAAGAAVFAFSHPIHAQSYPAKPVRVIIPFGAGGGTDIQGRLLAKKFFESMGQTFVSTTAPERAA